MGKMTKNKKEKIPKLTEAEYAEYISSLKTSDDSFLGCYGEEKNESNHEENVKEG